MFKPVTLQQLAYISKQAQDLNEILPSLNQVMEQHFIDTRLRQAHFLAQFFFAREYTDHPFGLDVLKAAQFWADSKLNLLADNDAFVQISFFLKGDQEPFPVGEWVDLELYLVRAKFSLRRNYR